MGKKKKNKEDVLVNIIGSNATNVTGSSTRIDFLNKHYLIECGIVQDGTMLNNYTTNLNLVNSINAEELECIFLFHAHADHSALIPALVNKGFKGKIYCTRATAEICYHLFMDSAFLMDKEAEAISKKKGYKVHPLYEEKDVTNTMKLIQECEYDKLYAVNENVSFKLLKNSHIVGASQGELYFRTPSNKVKKILYTSDLGNSVNKKPFVVDTEYCKTANLVLMESTYGKKSKTTTKSDRNNDINLIKELIDNIILGNKGRIVIPSFSLDRTQHLLVILYDIITNNDRYKDIPIIVDSKLTMNITNAYKKILQGDDLELIRKVTEWKNVTFIKDIKECKACIYDDTPKIVLSASGFIEGGHSQLYAQDSLPNLRDAILFCGYASPNSVAGRIRNPETKSVRMANKVCRKACRIESLKTFSSHAQHDELIKYIKVINTDKIVLIHGDKECKEELKNDANEELRKIGKTTTIVCSEKNMILKI